MQKFEAINVGEVRALNRPEEIEEHTPIDEEENDVQNDNFRHGEAENDVESSENEEIFEEDVDETTDELTTEFTESNDTNSSKKNSNLKELPRTSTG